MPTTLRRNIYDPRAPGYLTEQVRIPDLDPLAASCYSCIYWIDHLCEWNSNSDTNHQGDLQDGGILDVFIKEISLLARGFQSEMRCSESGTCDEEPRGIHSGEI